MCLITSQQEPLITTEDMTVYKTLNRNLTSLHQYFTYEFTELYVTKILDSNPNKWGNYVCADGTEESYLRTNYPEWKRGDNRLKYLGQGFHSYATKERAETASFTSFMDILVECTVPKGSEYYLSATGLCISNQIIINKEIKIR